MEVIELDCSDYVSITANLCPATPMILEVPSTPTTPLTSLITGSDYAQTTYASECPLTFTLKTVTPDATYSGS